MDICLCWSIATYVFYTSKTYRFLIRMCAWVQWLIWSRTVFELRTNKINCCLTNNQVIISGCPSKFVVVRTWKKVLVLAYYTWIWWVLASFGYATDLLLSVGQLHHYFWLSSNFFGYPVYTDNQRFERCISSYKYFFLHQNGFNDFSEFETKICVGYCHII